MSVTFNAGFNLYEGTLAERPVEGSTYSGAFYRASDTGAVYRCESQPSERGFSITGNSGLYWNTAFTADTFYSQIGPGSPIGNTTTETTFDTSIGLLGPYTISLGTVLRVSACFRYSSKALLPGTLTLKLQHDDGTPTSMLESGAYTMPAAVSSKDIFFIALLTCSAAGSIIGRVEATGLCSDSGAGVMIPLAAVNVGTSFDTLVDETFRFTAQFSLADAANTITLRQFIIEILSATEG